MDPIAQNVAELCDAVAAVVWRVDGKASTSLHTWIDPMQVQEQDDEIDRIHLGRAVIDHEAEVAPQKVSAGAKHVTANLRRSL